VNPEMGRLSKPIMKLSNDDKIAVMNFKKAKKKEKKHRRKDYLTKTIQKLENDLMRLDDEHHEMN
jgi:hypothetical protein